MSYIVTPWERDEETFRLESNMFIDSDYDVCLQFV